MTNNPITVDGKDYTVSEETTYTMEPGKLYKDACSKTARINSYGVTQQLYDPGWSIATVRFPLRELIPVGPKVREIRNAYMSTLGGADTRNALLKSHIKEALQASHLRIHNADGSVTEYENDPAYYNVVVAKNFIDGKQIGATYEVTLQVLRSEAQLAFMRGSTVEVVE